MSWAMCQPARVEWQSPQCLVNPACGQKKEEEKNKKGTKWLTIVRNQANATVTFM